MCISVSAEVEQVPIEIERAFRGSNGELFRGGRGARGSGGGAGGVNGREMQRRLQHPAACARVAHSTDRHEASRLRNLRRIPFIAVREPSSRDH